jgi:rhodanese-related sulfurtransferase
MPYYGQNDPMPPFWGHEPVPKIDADTAAKAIEAGATLVEIGQPEDWLTGHIPNALLVEPELLDMERERIPKDQPVVVASHGRGIDEEVVDSMRRRGYDAAVLDGGVAAWKASGRELHAADGRPAR